MDPLEIKHAVAGYCVANAERLRGALRGYKFLERIGPFMDEEEEHRKLPIAYGYVVDVLADMMETDNFFYCNNNHYIIHPLSGEVRLLNKPSVSDIAIDIYGLDFKPVRRGVLEVYAQKIPRPESSKDRFYTLRTKKRFLAYSEIMGLEEFDVERGSDVENRICNLFGID